MPAPTPLITVHWLDNSRSQRILWLLEELDLPYTVKEYKRDPNTMLAPSTLTAIHPLGKSPVITIQAPNAPLITLAESGAITTYLIETYGPHLQVPVGHPLRSEYLYWTHFAEGTAMLPLIFSIVFAQMPRQSPFPVRPLVWVIAQSVMRIYVKPKLISNFSFIEKTLSTTTSSEEPVGNVPNFFVDDHLTGADIMMSFPVEAIESALGSFEAHPNAKRWLDAMHARPAFLRALKRGGPTDLGMFTR